MKERLEKNEESQMLFFYFLFLPSGEWGKTKKLPGNLLRVDACPHLQLVLPRRWPQVLGFEDAVAGVFHGAACRFRS